jgi:hypothetical protein
VILGVELMSVGSVGGERLDNFRCLMRFDALLFGPPLKFS